MTGTGRDFSLNSENGFRENTGDPAENTAWSSFYHSGKIEDYIRYAQLRQQVEPKAAQGVLHADKDPRTDY